MIMIIISYDFIKLTFWITVLTSLWHTSGPGTKEHPLAPHTSFGTLKHSEIGVTFVLSNFWTSHLTLGHFVHSSVVVYPDATSLQSVSNTVWQFTTSSITLWMWFLVSQRVSWAVRHSFSPKQERLIWKYNIHYAS